MSELTFAKMRRKALKYIELTERLTELIKLYKIAPQEICKKAGISQTHFYRRLNNGNLTNEQITAFFRTVIEENILLKDKLKNHEQRES